MKAICPNNREHDTFITTAHILQDWMVDSSGMHLSTIDECVQITHKPNIENIWECATCGAEAILTGEIRELYATVLEGEESSYADIYDSKEEANAQIGKYIDGLKVVSVKKGYSLAPKGLKTLYNEAPDFCESILKIMDIANKLDITL